MTEENKYEIIKKLVETNGNKKAVSLKLGCTLRHINRMINGYITQGKEFFIHGNHNRRPIHAFSDETRKTIVDLYRTKYFDANFTHYSELLSKHENIIASASAIRSILMKEIILSPKANRSTKNRIKKELLALRDKAVLKREIEQITQSIVDIEDAHPRRPRCAYFGEMIQMDASVHHWFGSDKTQLHIGIDDSTGSIVGAYFDHQETLKGYYNILHQILNDYGIPFMFYTDRRTVFEYKQKKSPSVEEDTFTQFGFACKQLGIEIKTSSVPQAKGRVERLFQTLQSRLPLELRLAGVTTLEQANIFLDHYVKEYNAKFALKVDNIKSVFEKQPSDEKINLVLAVIAERKFDNGHCIRFEKKYLKPINCNGYPVYYHKGTSCMVIRAFDGNLFTYVDNQVYALDEIPTHEYTSKNFDFSVKPLNPQKRYIPSLDHPWRQSFKKHVNSQAHRSELAV